MHRSEYLLDKSMFSFPVNTELLHTGVFYMFLHAYVNAFVAYLELGTCWSTLSRSSLDTSSLSPALLHPVKCQSNHFPIAPAGIKPIKTHKQSHVGQISICDHGNDCVCLERVSAVFGVKLEKVLVVICNMCVWLFSVRFFVLHLPHSSFICMYRYIRAYTSGE